MRLTFALSTLSLLACTDAPRALLTDLPPPPPADMAVPPAPPDLSLMTLAIATVTPAIVSTVGRDTVTVTGNGFDSRTSFLVGGQAAEVVSVTSTQATILAPANPGNWGIPITIQALRTLDGARATNSNAVASMSKFSYYASTPAFQQIGRYNIVSANTVRVPLVGDFNGDGRPDFMNTSQVTGSHQTYINTGGGAFTLTENSVNSVATVVVQKGTVVDLNGDTFLDVIIADEVNTWAYVMGNGQGLFNTAAGSPSTSYNAGCAATSAPSPIKLSSNTNYDVAVACTTSGVVRTWASPAGAATNAFYGTQNTASQGTTLTISGPQHLQVVDVNKDTYNDLVVLSNTNNAPTLTWYNAPGAPPVTLSTTASGNTGGANTPGANQFNQNPYWLKCADLNNDGYPDCVVSDLATATVRVFMNNAGIFQPPTANGTIAVGQDPREINLADMNGDGKLDLVVATRVSNGFEVIPGRADGSFGPIVSSDGRILGGRASIIVPDCLRTWSVQTADFDGDGMRDIMTTCEASAAANFTNGGTVLFRNSSR